MNETTKITINKGIPTPDVGRAGGMPAKFPWQDMEPGDSFFAAGYATNTTNAKNGERAISTNMGTKIFPGSKWIMRRATENGVNGVRVWRVA